MRINANGTLVALTVAIVLLPGCWRRPQVVVIYSPDRSQCISVITQDTCRYIVNGEHESVPNSGYVKLDISRIDLDTRLYICWKNVEVEWEVVQYHSRIIESSLDSTRYRFSTALPLDSLGFPTEMKFHFPGCAVFDFYNMRLIRNEGAIVEIR